MENKSQSRLFYGILIGIVLVSIFSLYYVSAPGSINTENNGTIGYEFLDNEQVVHIWNTQDDYYFNKSSGIQFTNHYEDYWTKNIFCIGYYSGEEWIKIACADELSKFTKTIETDNLTYVNATLWKDISYGVYDMRLGVQYHLGLDDKNLSITIYGKNIGIDIPFDLGFAWKITNIEIPINVGGDMIRINKTNYYLNENIDLLFKNMTETYEYTTYDNSKKNDSFIEIKYNSIPSFRISDDTEFLKVDWNKNINYSVKMYGNGNQNDFYIALLINAGHFNPNQEKSTTFQWIDAEGDYIGTWSLNALNVNPDGINQNVLISSDVSKSINWNIEKSGIEENLDVNFKIINQTTTQFCIDFIDEAKYLSEVSKTGNIKSIPITKLSTDSILSLKNSIDLSIKNRCFNVNYKEQIAGLSFKIGDNSININSTIDTDATEGIGKNIYRDIWGNLNVAYTSSGNDIGFARSTDNGTTWAGSEVATGTYDDVGITGNSSGGLMIYFSDGADIDSLTSTDNGTTWTAVNSLLDTTGGFEEPSCDTDSNNIYHCCAVDITDMTVWYANSSVWNSEIQTYDGGTTTRCAIAININNTINILNVDSSNDNVSISNKQPILGETGFTAVSVYKGSGTNFPNTPSLGISTSSTQDVYGNDIFLLFGNDTNSVGCTYPLDCNIINGSYNAHLTGAWNSDYQALVLSGNGTTAGGNSNLSISSNLSYLNDPNWLTSKLDIKADFPSIAGQIFPSQARLNGVAYIVYTNSSGIFFTSQNMNVDTTAPTINFTDPTPGTGTQSNNNIFVNVSASDSGVGNNNISTFIDFDNSLVSWWRMDDVNQTGVGAKVIDYMERNNGTAYGQAQQTDAGKMGKGFSFDGSGDYINTGNTLHLSLPITFSGWIYPLDITQTRGIWTNDRSESGSTHHGIIVYSGTDASIGVNFGDNTACLSSGRRSKVTAGGTISVNNWHYITVVIVNGTNMSIYIDGTDVGGTYSGTGGNVVYTFNNGSIGRLGDCNPGVIYDFNGTIDDVMIFNRSLTASEIASLYANTTSKYVSNNFTGLANGNHIFKAYAQDTAGNVNMTEQRTVTISSANTCSYSSGNFVVNCADYCNITTNINGGGTGNNFTAIGVGWFKMSANISGFKNYKFGGGCNATCTSTGCIRI